MTVKEKLEVKKKVQSKKNKHVELNNIGSTSETMLMKNVTPQSHRAILLEITLGFWVNL